MRINIYLMIKFTIEICLLKLFFVIYTTIKVNLKFFYDIFYNTHSHFIFFKIHFLKMLLVSNIV